APRQGQQLLSPCGNPKSSYFWGASTSPGRPSPPFISCPLPTHSREWTWRDSKPHLLPRRCTMLPLHHSPTGRKCNVDELNMHGYRSQPDDHTLRIRMLLICYLSVSL